MAENEVNDLSEKNKLLSTKDYNFFLGRMYLTGDDSFQNMFIHQPAFGTLQLKKDKGVNYILSWKPKAEYSSTLFPQHTAFLHSIKPFGYKIGVKFHKDLKSTTKQLRN